MTTDTPPTADVVPFPHRRAAVTTTPDGQRLECHLCRHIAANEPRPLAVQMRLNGHPLGIIARFEDDEAGRAQGQVAADAAIATILMLWNLSDADKQRAAIGAGYTGDQCPNCRGFTIRREGDQLVCLMCRTATACS